MRPCGGCRRRPSSASPTVWLTRICAKSWWRCLDTGSFNSRSAVFSSYISPTFVQTGTRIRSLIASLGATGSGFGTRGTPLTTTGTPPVTSPPSLSFSVAIPTLSGTTGSQMPLKSQRPKTGLEPSRVVLYPFAEHSVRHGDPLERYGGRHDAPSLVSRHRLHCLGTGRTGPGLCLLRAHDAYLRSSLSPFLHP